MNRTRMIRKLKSTRGESIVEVLVAMLITALSVATLALMINTSVKVTKQSEDIMQGYYAANDALNRQDSSGSDSEGTVTMTMDDGDESYDFDIELFENDSIRNIPVIAYKKKPETP